MASADEIAAYYDKNTRHFLAFGGSGDVAAIHRAIWAPGVNSRAEAFHYLNQQVAFALEPLRQQTAAATRVLDLGCGVGGTSTWLAQTAGIDVTGITISKQQQQQASMRADRLGLAAHCRFIQADFAHMPELAPMDAAFAIESFVHADDAASFFAMAARCIRPGGRLIVCDDFLASAQPSASAQYWVERFRRGWHLNNLVTSEQAMTAAQQAGFILLGQQNLSAHIRAFNAPMLLVLSHLTRLPLPWAYWHNLAGGTALQRCLQRGWTQYQVLVWQRAH